MARRKGLVINDRQLDRCDDLLQKLKEVSGSSFLALISTSGQPITTASDEYHPETLSLASLAASSFAATQQLARILDENEFTLLFHEGKALNLHVSQVNDQVLLRQGCCSFGGAPPRGGPCRSAGGGRPGSRHGPRGGPA